MSTHTEFASDTAGSAATAALPAPQRVIDYVRGRIERGELRSGDRLPPERELARQVGVSRPTLRAALRTLAAMRLVESRHGFGTYVSSGPPVLDGDAMALMATLHGVSDGQMLEARRVVEVNAAALAASRARRYDSARLTAIVDALSAAVDAPDTFAAHDRAFHRLLGQLAGNPVLAALVDMFAGSACDGCRRADAGRRERRAQATLHRRLALAIQSGDGAQAQSVARRLLRYPKAPSRARRAPLEWLANAS